ncbi:MAG: GntR family transcriptional regulator [Hungatella sp.]|nr:GntR family transcriptional regulator [Hungatella sp.]
MDKSVKEDKFSNAYEYIKNKIILGEYLPLQDISDMELQKELGMSRTPIREAIQRLEKDSFVKIYPRKGTLVGEIDYNLVNAIYEVRLLNEPYIAVECYNRLSKDWLKKMYDSFQSPPEFKDHEEYVKYYTRLDDCLHNTVISQSQNSFLKELLNVVADHSNRIRVYCAKVNLNYTLSIEEHLEILDSMLCNNDADVLENYKMHIKSSWNNAMDLIFPKKSIM